jgi:hypothetical protein
MQPTGTRYFDELLSNGLISDCPGIVMIRHSSPPAPVTFLPSHSSRLGFKPRAMWPRGADPVHVYASDGTWAFDHAGWTRESELIRSSREAEPHAGDSDGPLGVDLDILFLCARHYYRTRREFAFDPWDRGRQYVTRFASPSGIGRFSATAALSLHPRFGTSIAIVMGLTPPGG